MWEAMLIVLCMAFWQWFKLRGQSPPSRWSILVDEGCLALPSELSLVGGTVRQGRISVWLTEMEFVFVDGNQEKKLDVIDATVLGSVKRDAINELILLFGEEAIRAAKKLGFSEEALEFHCLEPSNSLVLLIRGKAVYGMSVNHAFCLDQSVASIPIHEHVIWFFQEHTHAPIRVTI
jgi:hypothetical protein